MSESGSVENYRADNSSANSDGEVPENRILTQEAVNEQIKGFIAPLTRQLEELTRLVQGMVATPRPTHYPRTDYHIISGTIVHQPDRTSFFVVIEETLRVEIVKLKEHLGVIPI